MGIQDNLIEFVNWTNNPVGGPDSVSRVLEKLTDGELVYAAINFSGAAARLAWAEYARRRGFFNFEIKTVESEGKLVVEINAEGTPVHEHPVFS